LFHRGDHKDQAAGDKRAADGVGISDNTRRLEALGAHQKGAGASLPAGRWEPCKAGA